MIIMAVDLGLRRTGVAVSDAGENFAFPRDVVFEGNEIKLVEKLTVIAQENKAELIVVGLPKNMDGSLGFRAEECQNTAKLLKEASGIEVEMWDERCTTVMAHNALNITNTRGEKRKKTVDAVAAVLILESYLEYRKKNK